MNALKIGELLAVLKVAASFETKETTTVVHNLGDYNVGYAIDAIVKKVKAEIESPETIDDEIRDVVVELKNALSPIKDMAKAVASMKSAFDTIAETFRVISESSKSAKEPIPAVATEKKAVNPEDDLPY